MWKIDELEDIRQITCELKNISGKSKIVTEKFPTKIQPWMPWKNTNKKLASQITILSEVFTRVVCYKNCKHSSEHNINVQLLLTTKAL